jgi:hypothetical protein
VALGRVTAAPGEVMAAPGGGVGKRTRWPVYRVRPGEGNGHREVVVRVWWTYIVAVVVIGCGIYGFARLVLFQTRAMTRKTERRAEDMYDSYADSPRRRRRRA